MDVVLHVQIVFCIGKIILEKKVVKEKSRQMGGFIAVNITFPASIYLLKVNNRNTRRNCEICSKLTIKTPERRH